MDAIARELASLTLPDCSGGQHRLAEFWRERAAVFVFLRHYG